MLAGRGLYVAVAGFDVAGGKMILCEIHFRVRGKGLKMTQSGLLIANRVRVTDTFYRYD